MFVLVQYLDTVRHFFWDVETMVDSINAKKTIKKIRRGLSIYRTGRSPFWHAWIYDPVKKKYVVRSTKETNRIEAIEVAEEILETYKSKQNSSHATSKDRSFEYYAKLLPIFMMKQTIRMLLVQLNIWKIIANL